MANRVLTLSTEQPAKSTLLVYSDIDLDGTPAPIKYKSVWVSPDATSYLVDQNSENYIQASVSYDTQNDSSAIHKEKILLLNKLARKNADASNYNQEQTNKSNFKLEKYINVNAIKNSVKNIFQWTPGERILNPEFGSNLRQYLYRGITTYNVEAIMAEIQRCFTKWEPRARLVSVKDISGVGDTEDNTVQLEIIYTIPSLSREQYSYTVEVSRAV